MAVMTAKGVFIPNTMRNISYLLILLLLACSKETMPDSYTLYFQNNYFETVEVQVASSFSERIATKATSKALVLESGTHTITAITASRLQLESTIQLQGSQERLVIEISPKGKIQILR